MKKPVSLVGRCLTIVFCLWYWPVMGVAAREVWSDPLQSAVSKTALIGFLIGTASCATVLAWSQWWREE